MARMGNVSSEGELKLFVPEQLFVVSQLVCFELACCRVDTIAESTSARFVCVRLPAVVVLWAAGFLVSGPVAALQFADRVSALWIE